MILKLAIEQARSQRRYTAWTAALLTLVLAATTFGLILLANQILIQRDVASAYGTDRDTMLFVPSGVGHAPGDPDMTYVAPDGLPLDVLDEVISHAIAEGSDLIALRQGLLLADSNSTEPYEGPMLNATAVTGAFDWEVVLAEGISPGPGEVAVSARWAEEHGVGLGDSVSFQGVTVGGGPNTQDTRLNPSVTYEVSGLLKACGDGFGYQSWCPEAYLSWEESAVEGSAFMYPVHHSSDGVRLGWVLETTLAYTVDVPALTRLDGYSFGFRYGGDVGTVPPGTWLASGFAGLFVIGMVVVAFAVGRAQAQARLAWVATARTLGATKRAVASASILETLLVAAASTVAALLLGVAAAISHRAIHLTVTPHPLIPDSLSMPWWVFAGAVASGLLLAVITAAVPAFWAARVPPVAALKPVNDLMEAEVSRRVSVRWLVGLFALGVVAVVAGGPGSGVAQTSLTAGYIVTGVTGFALGLEGLRHAIPAYGRRLSRGRSSWAIAAGDSLAARPRQGVAPSLLQATTLAFCASGLGALALQGFPEWSSSWGDSSDAVGRDFWPPEIGYAWAWFAGAFAIVQVIALAIAFVGQRASSGDAATRRALGLSESAQRRAAFAQYVTPQAIGAVSGAIVGLAAAVFYHASYPHVMPTTAAITTSEVTVAAAHAAWWCLGLVSIALLVMAIGGLIVAASAGSRTPVEALRQVG